MGFTKIEKDRAGVHEPLTLCYHGTIGPVELESSIVSSARVEAESILGRGTHPSAVPRSEAVWAASSIRDATAIAAIRSYSRSAPIPHAYIHVYQVQLVPFHAGPVAVIEELQSRLLAGRQASLEPLIREYWEPMGTWNLQEILAASLTVLKEVPATTEREVYVRRWVHYNQDCERAQSL